MDKSCCRPSSSVLVILAAGVGSRMNEVTDLTNKCIVDLNGITPLEYTISNFSKYGVKDVVVVVGHYANSVIHKLKSSEVANSLESLRFINNDYYKFHGCEASVALALSSHITDYDTVYLTEGDLLLHPEYIKSIIDSDKSQYQSSVLIRSSDNIAETRSVVAVDNQGTGLVSRFVYDPDHTSTSRLINKDESVIGESLQLWRFSGESLSALKLYTQEYMDDIITSLEPRLESGIYSINKVIKEIESMYPVKVEGTDWLNLNTIEDINIGRLLEWVKF